MKIRAVVLTVLLIGLVIPAFSQLEDLFINQTHPLTFINDPFMPVVKVILVGEDGKILVKLQNGFAETVQLKGVSIVSNGIRVALLEEAEELFPADTRYFDLSGHLRRCFDPDSSVRQEKLISIHLSVEPEPQGQPAKLIYRVGFEDGVFTDFEKSPTQSS